MRTRRRRLGAVGAVFALLGSLFVAFVASAPFAGASTSQNNGCLGVTGTWSTFPIPITGTAAPKPITSGGTTTLSGTSVTIAVDGVLVGAGVTTGLVQAAPSLAALGTAGGAGGTLQGQNAVTANPGDITLKITGTNTTQGTQTTSNPAALGVTFWVVNDAVSGVITIYQGTPNPPTNTNLTITTLIVVPIPLSDTTWTSNSGGNISLAETVSTPSSLTAPNVADKAAAPLRILPKINGAISVPFYCWTGSASADTLSLVPGPASPIDTVTVNLPPLPPVCTSSSISVGLGQSATVNPGTTCSDPNGDFTPSNTSVTVVTPPGAGTASVAANGVITYQSNTATPNPDSFTYRATDAAGNASAATTVTINILANQCDATTVACSLGQVVSVTVTGTTMKLDQTSQFVTMGGVTLNGEYQVTSGAVQQLTVTNARGTAPGWTVTGQVTDFKGATFAGANCATANRLCIPGDNLGWAPSAAIAHTVIPGDVAAVTAGPALTNTAQPWVNVGGTSGGALHGAARTLCTSAADHSGGTFHCNALLYLAVPASAGADTYTATLTLTLV